MFPLDVEHHASRIATMGLLAFAIGGCMNRSSPEPAAPVQQSAETMATVRYQVADTERAIALYTHQLGFTLEQHVGKAFASVVRGKLRLILGGPGSSGSRPMPD